VRAAFLQIAATNPSRYRVIDADRDVAQVAADIVDAVNACFSLHLQPVAAGL